MADYLTDIAQLEAIYGAAFPGSLIKVADHLTPEYRRWVEAAKFCVLSTIGPEGTDGTPRGDDGPVVLVKDPQTVLMPDWAGNNRIDSLRNIVRDPRCSLMFLIAGENNVVRINGTCQVTADQDMRQQFAKGSKLPRTVLVFAITEVYFQCAKAVMRAALWQGETRSDLPTAGDFLKAMSKGTEGGAAYDAAYEDRARAQFWVRDT